MSNYKVELANSFKKDYKKIKKQGKDAAVDALIKRIEDGKTLEPHHRDHALGGQYLGYRECHIEPDLLLIYRIFKDTLVLVCVRVGSHSELGLD